MRIAVIGAGNWGKNLVKNLNNMGYLSGIVEINPQLRDSYSKEYPNTKIYPDLDSFIKEDFDAAVVATPAPYHFEIAEKILLRGKDVLVEKPITLTSADAQTLLNLATENNRVLMVNHLLMYQPAVQWIKKALESKLIGKLYRIHQKRLALGRARNIENVLWSLGVHDIAVSQFLIDSKPIKMKAHGQCVLNNNIEDDVYLHVEYENGVHSNLHCSWLWYETNRGMVLIGSEGMLFYNEMEQKVYLYKKTIDENLCNVDNGSELVYEGSGEPVKLMLEHFVHCINTNTTPISDGNNALEVVKILEQAEKELKQ
ncbi:MAG: Gfo/Idh/MocA family oxidoreductase [Armatimonadota bacterium]